LLNSFLIKPGELPVLGTPFAGLCALRDLVADDVTGAKKLRSALRCQYPDRKGIVTTQNHWFVAEGWKTMEVFEDTAKVHPRDEGWQSRRQLYAERLLLGAGKVTSELGMGPAIAGSKRKVGRSAANRSPSSLRLYGGDLAMDAMSGEEER